MMQHRSKALLLSDRVYRLLLFAYPTSFRREYGALMAQLFQDKCRASLANYGSIGLSQLWLHTLFDWSKTVFEQHIEEAFHMSGQQWIIRLGALAALAGGLLGLYLVSQGPNSYGNYGWSGWLAPVASALLALGLAGAIAAHKKQANAFGWFGGITAIAGLLLMAVGLTFDSMWGFIFFGPIIILPIGSIMLGISIYRRESLPTWWRFFPFVVVAIAVLGLSIELIEGMMGNATPDRGLQLTEALFSLVWIGLGLGLWLDRETRPDDPRLAA